MQYSRELNMKAIRTAAETARFMGIDAITITTTNYNIINAFNSVDHLGSLLHGYKHGIGSVARKNWYTMVGIMFKTQQGNNNCIRYQCLGLKFSSAGWKIWIRRPGWRP